MEAYRQALRINPRFFKAHYQLGITLRDQKDLNGAVLHFRKAVELEPSNPIYHNNLGLVLRDRGRFAEALEELRQAHALGSRRPDWTDPTAQCVHECATLLKLDQKWPEVLQDKTRADSPQELLNLAELGWRYKQHFAAAARFYADAFAAAPSLAEQLDKQHRYQAACSAALAAAGRGKDAAVLGVKDKVSLRRQALDWLKADLDLYRRKVASVPAKAGEPPSPAGVLAQLTQLSAAGSAVEVLLVWQRLSDWQTNPDLGGVREAGELARLPAGEEPAWRQLWADVARLRQQARACFVETCLAGTVIGQEPLQTHEVRLTAGKTYIVDLTSQAFRATLSVRDDRGKVLAESNSREPAGPSTTRLVFTPSRDGNHRLLVASLQPRRTGDYTLVIHEFADPPKK
jgi:hypothetical protein